MITYTNVERFEEWLKSILKVYHGNIEDYLDELNRKYMANASPSYEVRGFFTKSGNPECYSYEVVDSYDDDEEFIGREFIF